MIHMTKLWWRLRYAYWMWRWTRCSFSFAWDAAYAAEIEDTLKDACDAELSYWSDDG